MAYQKLSVTATTAADGSATVFIPEAVATVPGTNKLTGRLVTLIYDKTDFATGVDFTTTSEDAGETLWTENNVDASTVRSPRQPTHAGDGTASLYAGAGEPVEGAIVLVDDRIKWVIAAGGDTKTGKLTAIFEDKV